MKDQYVGDVNDFFKYAFLRSVQDHLAAPLVVCWLATANDGGPDGRRRRYLSQPEKYRSIDSSLFDSMQRLVATAEPRIADVERAAILPRAMFFRRILGDSLAERDGFFDELWQRVPTDATIFFDPDNGLEIKSTLKGRKGSSKYLYMDELEIAGRGGHSVVVYQHFGRVERTAYTDDQLQRMKAALPEHDLFALTGTHIAFLVAATKASSDPLRAVAAALRGQWSDLQAVDHLD